MNKIDTPNKETKCQFLVIHGKINSNFLIGNSSLISGQCYFSILCVLKGIWRSLVFCSSWIQTENIRSNELSYWPVNLIRSYQVCYKISTLVNKINMWVKCQQQRWTKFHFLENQIWILHPLKANATFLYFTSLKISKNWISVL